MTRVNLIKIILPPFQASVSKSVKTKRLLACSKTKPLENRLKNLLVYALNCTLTNSMKKNTKKCKGVKRNVVAKSITHDDYKNYLMTKNEQLRKMNVIRFHLHDIYTEQINEVALSADDDKRIILEGGVSNLAYGHYKCPIGFLKIT